MVDTADRTTRESEEASRAIFTLANVVSFVRLLMVPLYLFLLMNGQNLAADRVLMGTGVLGVFLVGRIPLWVIVVVIVRDAYLLIGGARLLSRHRIRIPVVYPGKFATTFLFIGFSGLLLNWPLVPGLGWCDASWLPGFNGAPVSWGIWFIYAGLVLSLGVTVYYSVCAARQLKEALARERLEGHGAA